MAVGPRPCPACPQMDGSLMMDKLNLDVVDVLLVEPDLDTRENIRNILHETGFRNLRIGKKLTELRDALVVSMPDLLISETELPDGDSASWFMRSGTTKSGPTRSFR